MRTNRRRHHLISVELIKHSVSEQNFFDWNCIFYAFGGGIFFLLKLSQFKSWSNWKLYVILNFISLNFILSQKIAHDYIKPHLIYLNAICFAYQHQTKVCVINLLCHCRKPIFFSALWTSSDEIKYTHTHADIWSNIFATWRMTHTSEWTVRAT